MVNACRIKRRRRNGGGRVRRRAMVFECSDEQGMTEDEYGESG
jgi:hypothetical protein